MRSPPATPPRLPISTPKFSPATPATSPRSRGWRVATSPPAISSRRRRRLPSFQRRSTTTSRSPPPAPRSNSLNRRNRSARPTNCKRRSMPTRSITSRASNSPPRSTRRTSAPRRPIICSPSSSATANGTRTARVNNWCSSSTPGARPTRRLWKAARSCRRFFSREAHARGETRMPMNADYRGPADLPSVQMPLNIFEPRYLAMIDDALRDGHRLIGMIQPDSAHEAARAKPKLYKTGCVGRITQLAESCRGRYIIELTCVSRFRVEEELKVQTEYRQCRVTYAPFTEDFVPRKGEDDVDREALLRALTDFMKANDMKADWEDIEEAPTEALVNGLSMMSPYGPPEKQALLEAPDLKTRADLLVAITEIEIAKKNIEGEPQLQSVSYTHLT